MNLLYNRFSTCRMLRPILLEQDPPLLVGSQPQLM